MKYCEDCKWYAVKKLDDCVINEKYLCTHPDAISGSMDYVHRNTKTYPDCYDQRNYYHVACCNPTGKRWEAKDAV